MNDYKRHPAAGSETAMMSYMDDDQHLEDVMIGANCMPKNSITLHNHTSSQTMVASPALASSALEGAEIATAGLASHEGFDSSNQANLTDGSAPQAAINETNKTHPKMRKFFTLIKKAFMHPQVEDEIETSPAPITTVHPTAPSKSTPTNESQSIPRQVVTLNELSYADPSNEQAQVVASAYGDIPIPECPNTGTEMTSCENTSSAVSSPSSSSSSAWKRRISFKKKPKGKVNQKVEDQEVMSQDNIAMTACVHFCAVVNPCHR